MLGVAPQYAGAIDQQIERPEPVGQGSHGDIVGDVEDARLEAVTSGER